MVGSADLVFKTNKTSEYHANASVTEQLAHERNFS